MGISAVSFEQVRHFGTRTIGITFKYRTTITIDTIVLL